MSKRNERNRTTKRSEKKKYMIIYCEIVLCEKKTNGTQMNE